MFLFLLLLFSLCLLLFLFGLLLLVLLVLLLLFFLLDIEATFGLELELMCLGRDLEEDSFVDDFGGVLIFCFFIGGNMVSISSDDQSLSSLPKPLFMMSKICGKFSYT